MDQMILSVPSIIIIWTYQDRMKWMSRTLVEVMACADEDSSVDVGKMQLNFVQAQFPNPTQHDPHVTDDLFRTINYLHLEKAMSKILVGEMAGANEDFSIEFGKTQLNFFKPNSLMQLSKIHMDQI
jgi:hypothetical protein